MTSNEGSADTHSLRSIFFPSSVAIAGVGERNSGRQYLDSLLLSGFTGPIYPVNGRGGEADGLSLYRTVKDIPGTVDYVISCIPADAVPKLITDCCEKGARVVSLFTAGFSEVGTEIGLRLEAEISDLARANGIRILGPNCMGVYCPSSGMSFVDDFPSESGPVALVSQSGGNAIYLVRSAAQRGVRFSKVISYGNGCDVDESDLLDYLAHDPETQVATVYIEGVRDGAKFARSLRKLASEKPVVVLKAGNSADGARSAASHTGSMAGAGAAWSGLIRQCGAIEVSTLEEMIDMMVTLPFLPVPGGRNVAVAGYGGGASVLAGDVCNSYGLSLPPAHEMVSREIASHIRSEAGLVLTNPVELNLPPQAAYQATRCLAASESVDLVLVNCVCGQTPWPIYDDLADRLADTVIRVHAEMGRPTVVALDPHVPQTRDQFCRLQQRYCESGLPVYHSMHSACLAVDRLLRYHAR